MLRRHIEEIHNDAGLRLYGALLAFLQVLSAVYWLARGTTGWLAKGSEAICWPSFPDCESWRVLGPDGTRLAIIAFLLAGVGVMALFASRRTTKAAYFSLLLLNVAKLGILAMDFRFRMNQHLMAGCVTAAYLFLPGKKQAVRILVVLFYFWAGTLKLNQEWISGSALYAKLWLFRGEYVSWACLYVVVLELALVWLVWLGGRSWLAWATFAQLVLFHVFSFPIVGFFYPLLMFAILAIYPISWWRPTPTPAPRFAHLAMVVVFSAFQLLPKLMPGDTAVTGEGRFLSLDMFDAKTECEARARVRSRDGRVEVVDLRMPLPIRLHCDPIVYLSRARRLCRDPRVVNLDWTLRTRRSDEKELRGVVDQRDFCDRRLRYSSLLPNDWIAKRVSRN